MQISIKKWLYDARVALQQVDISSSHLDSELILSHALQRSREYLMTHDDEKVNMDILRQADVWLKRRTQREPLAYIFGEKEFYGRKFIVTPDTLIPRPETETIIKLCKKYQLSGRVLDVGTGSGCIGLTLKIENPDISLTVSDVSDSALKVARKNAQMLEVKPVRYVTSDLLEHWLSHKRPKKFDAIIANLPYVGRDWYTSPETASEPDLALYAADDGVELIKRLINQSYQLISSRGYLILEADPRQHTTIISYAADYDHVETDDFILVLQSTN